MPSQYVAGFELVAELGRGGYTVTHRVLRHSSIYAMKILQRRGGEELPERAFRREAALLASVNHPGVVRVHEVGVADEEFALLMPDGPDPAAIAERVRSAIAGTPVRTKAGPLTVTVSVGAVSLSPVDADLSALLGRADRRLYDAKRAGRNRVVAE